MIIKLDSFGRFVIPKAFRKMLGIERDGVIKLEIKDKQLIITKGEE